jgi:hypothetical protein
MMGISSLVHKRAWLSPLVLATLVGCGDSSSDGNGGSGGGSGTGVTVSGGVVYHSLNKLAMTTAEYSELEVALVGESALLAGDTNAIASQPLATTPTMTTGQTPFSFSKLDLSGASGGVFARISDTRSTPLWVTTETSSIDAATLSGLTSGTTYSSAVGFALSHDALAGPIATLAGTTGDALLASGMVFGLVYGGIDTDGSGTPVTGATVVPSSTDYTIVYPNSMFTATQASTGGQGAFFAIPSSASASPRSVTFTVTPPSGQSLTWDATLPAVVRPGAVFFLRLYAK